MQFEKKNNSKQIFSKKNKDWNLRLWMNLLIFPILQPFSDYYTLLNFFAYGWLNLPPYFEILPKNKKASYRNFDSSLLPYSALQAP